MTLNLKDIYQHVLFDELPKLIFCTMNNVVVHPVTLGSCHLGTASNVEFEGREFECMQKMRTNAHYLSITRDCKRGRFNVQLIVFVD